jgi:hypothetical protein
MADLLCSSGVIFVFFLLSLSTAASRPLPKTACRPVHGRATPRVAGSKPRRAFAQSHARRIRTRPCRARRPSIGGAPESRCPIAERSVSDRDMRLAGSVRVTCAEAIATHTLARPPATCPGSISDITVELVPNPRELSLSMRKADISVRLKRPDQHDLLVRSAGYLGRHAELDFEGGCPGHHVVTKYDDIEHTTLTNCLADPAPRARVAMQTSSR